MRAINLDESLSYVAADVIAEGARFRPCSYRHGIFQLFLDDQGLSHNPMVWRKRISDTLLIPALPPCVCPDWMDCYCGGRKALA